MKDEGAKRAGAQLSFSLPCRSITPPTHTSRYLTHCNQSHQIPS